MEFRINRAGKMVSQLATLPCHPQGLSDVLFWPSQTHRNTDTDTHTQWGAHGHIDTCTYIKMKVIYTIIKNAVHITFILIIQT